LAVKKQNVRRLFLTFETLAELGPELTAERDFGETATTMLSLLMEAVGAREGALFTFNDRPAMMASAAAQGYVLFPNPAVIPLLPKHVHALANARGAVILTPKVHEGYLTANGNVAPELFKCLVPLRVGTRLVGMLALGRREGDAPYDSDEIEALGLLCTYVALAVSNHTLSQSLQQKISENLRLLGSIHNFYDHTLEAFANAIDVKDYSVRGHSIRVGRYAAGIAEVMQLEPTEVSGLRAAGYLHDIGKVAVDKRIFSKPAALDASEFREMADHTTVGHQIVSGVEFPWPKVPEVVRSHHERNDGSGYPDHLQSGEVPTHVKIVAVADSFDAMTSERPYRRPMSVGEAANALVQAAPTRLEGEVVQALLIGLRRDAVGREPRRLLDDHVPCTVAPADIDQMASLLNHKLTHGRVYSA
jgi:putative nucleotidyltransferase with HDIG domain